MAFDWVGGVIADHHVSIRVRARLHRWPRNTYGRGVYVTSQSAFVRGFIDGKDERGRPMFTDRVSIRVRARLHRWQKGGAR